MDRSEIMRRVRSENTGPERKVRKILTLLGYRYRLHRKDIPGKPDIAFIGRKKLIFVNGCFWHGHDCNRGARVPKSNKRYWKQKISRNVERDKINLELLEKEGWHVHIIWECEIRDLDQLADRLVDFLSN